MLDFNKTNVIFKHLCASDTGTRRDCLKSIARTRNDRIALQSGLQHTDIAQQSDRATTVHNCKPKNQIFKRY